MGESDGDSQLLGWLAILGAWLTFGSFAVPMKWPAVVEAQVHPLVYQCYKTFWTFVTSHLVLLLGFRYELTWWGILSGFSWVPAGVAAVVAVQHVGIARGQAIWQVTIILTSFVWGFFVLRDEEVYNVWGTVLSVVALTVGVVGMTLAFNLQRNLDTSDEDPPETSMQPEPGRDADPFAGQPAGADEPGADGPRRPVRKISSMGDLRSPVLGEPLAAGAAENGDAQIAVAVRVGIRASTTSVLFQRPGAGTAFATFGASALAGPYVLGRAKSRSSLSDLRFGAEDLLAAIDGRSSPRSTVLLNSRRVSDVIGIGAALFNGVWGGANLVPSHYAPVSGIHYTLSFAWGALIANVTLVMAYALLSKLWWRTPLPSPHFKVMALPGFLSGSLWSAGNFCSLYVVDSIGQGIGYSLIQSSVIVSGIWGICYYREMSGKPILFWVLWMLVCMAGVLGLAAEKKM